MARQSAQRSGQPARCVTCRLRYSQAFGGDQCVLLGKLCLINVQEIESLEPILMFCLPVTRPDPDRGGGDYHSKFPVSLGTIRTGHEIASLKELRLVLATGRMVLNVRQERLTFHREIW